MGPKSRIWDFRSSQWAPPVGDPPQHGPLDFGSHPNLQSHQIGKWLESTPFPKGLIMVSWNSVRANHVRVGVLALETAEGMNRVVNEITGISMGRPSWIKIELCPLLLTMEVMES